MPTLDWIGKKAVEKHHEEVPYHLLKCDPSLSVGDPGSGNLIIQGDNLLALKALLPYYAGKVKCIYIDPPYNTGNEGWIYNDNVNSPEIRDWLGKAVGGQMEDMCRHDKWLCMMFPRLILLHRLLRDDGVIFVSIDDNSVALLRMIMDEIFSASNFIATVVWQKKQSPQNDAINLSDMHDYLAVYAKRAKQNRGDPRGWGRNLVPRGQRQNERYRNVDNDPRGPWTSVDYTCNKTSTERPNLYYPITNPVTEQEIWPSTLRVWRFNKETHEKHEREHRVWWRDKDGGMPRLKLFMSDVAEGVVPSTWWPREEAGDNQEARREYRTIFGEEGLDFATPKPSSLVKRILQIASDENSLILDSFAGSGTTGHAALALNKADGGNRKFILVEMLPEVAQPITAERIKRVCEGYTNARGEKAEGLGGGFRFCTLSKEPMFDAEGRIQKDVTFSELARHVFFSETGEPLPKQNNGRSPLLGIAGDKAIYLLYNGILGEKSVHGGNVLTRQVLQHLPVHDGAKVIFGTGCRLSAERLGRERIQFRQIPYEIKVR